MGSDALPVQIKVIFDLTGFDIINRKKTYIWGCGHNAKAFTDRLRMYTDSNLTSKFREWWMNSVEGFIEGNPDRVGALFCGKPVVSPDEAMGLEMEYCIITVFARESIMRFLFDNGIKGDYCIYWKDFLGLCKLDVISERTDILKRLIEGSDILSRYLVFSLEIEKASDRIDKQKLIDKVRISDKQYEWISAFAWYFGDNIDDAEKWFDGIIDQDSYQGFHENSTVGMFVDKYYGGGIEKVVSLLLSNFCDRNYKTVLITEEINEDKDYCIPAGTSRCIVREPHDGVTEYRLEQLENCIRRNEIGIMVFHSGYARVPTYYELLLVRMMGVPVILVLHSALPAVLADQRDISDKFKYIYRMADEMVAVSERDKEMLETLGCSCSYIQNPVDTFGVDRYTQLIPKDYFQILWTGRIEQRAKQVFDTAKIMKIVYDGGYNAKLRIIGGADNPGVYRELRNLIREYGLETVVELSEYNKDICEIYREADAVLITSSTESFSNVLAEAKVMSRPVVMYELPWLSLVKDGRGIIQVKQGDVVAAADALIRLIGDRGLLEEYSINSWESIQPFISRNIVNDWQSVLKKASEKVANR